MCKLLDSETLFQCYKMKRGSSWLYAAIVQEAAGPEFRVI